MILVKLDGPPVGLAEKITNGDVPCALPYWSFTHWTFLESDVTFISSISLHPSVQSLYFESMTTILQLNKSSVVFILTTYEVKYRKEYICASDNELLERYSLF